MGTPLGPSWAVFILTSATAMLKNRLLVVGIDWQTEQQALVCSCVFSVLNLWGPPRGGTGVAPTSPSWALFILTSAAAMLKNHAVSGRHRLANRAATTCCLFLCVLFLQTFLPPPGGHGLPAPGLKEHSIRTESHLYRQAGLYVAALRQRLC